MLLLHIFKEKENNNDTLASRWHGIHFIPPPEGNPKTLTPGPRTPTTDRVVDYLRTGHTDYPYGPLYGPPPKQNLKKTKTEIKIHLLLVHCNRSLVSKFRALRWEHVTDLSSVSSYIIDIPHCHFFLCCGYKYIWKTGKSPGSLEICAALSPFPSPFCSACSPAGSWTRPRLHILPSKQNGDGKEITNLLGFLVFHAKPHQRKW